MEQIGDCPRYGNMRNIFSIIRLAAVVGTVLLARSANWRLSADSAKQLPLVNREAIPLNVALRFWSHDAGNITFPGGQHPRTFDTIFWGGGRSGRAAAIAICSGSRFRMAQLLGNNLICYTTFNGGRYRTLLLDTHGGGSLLMFHTKLPLLHLYFGLNRNQTRPYAFDSVELATAMPALQIQLSGRWFRIMSQHCRRLSYSHSTGVLKIVTMGKRSSSRVNLTFSAWPKERGFQTAVFVSAIDRLADDSGRRVATHLRFAADGLFPELPVRMLRRASSMIAGMKVRVIEPSRFRSVIPKVSGFITGKMSAPAAARRRFLNWVVGPVEAGRLDGWIYKGVSPLGTADHKQKGDWK